MATIRSSGKNCDNYLQKQIKYIKSLLCARGSVKGLTYMTLFNLKYVTISIL